MLVPQSFSSLFFWSPFRACDKDKLTLTRGTDSGSARGGILHRGKPRGSSTALCSLFLLALAFSPGYAAAGSPDPADSKIPLHADWTLQSSCQIKATGEQIS